MGAALNINTNLVDKEVENTFTTELEFNFKEGLQMEIAVFTVCIIFVYAIIVEIKKK